jgi:hypothetical protein
MQNSDEYSYVVTGAAEITSWSALGVTGRTDALTADKKTLTATAGSSATPAAPTAVTFKVTAPGTLTVDVKEKDGGGAIATIETFTIIASAGTACANNKLSIADSYIQVVNESSSLPASSNVDEAGGLVSVDGDESIIALALKDAYTVALSGTCALIATATNGVAIAWDAAPTTDSSTAVATGCGASGTELYVKQNTANTNKPVDTVVTITLDGTLVTTKSLKFTGDLASIAVSSVRRAVTNDTSYNSFTVRTYDSAKNQIGWGDSSLVVQGFDQNVTAGDAVATATAAAETTATNDGNYVTCAAGAKGTTKLKVRGTTGVGSYVYSPEFEVSCSGASYSYSAALDKAVYAPGDIATLTITAKDINGNLVYDPVASTSSSGNDLINYVYGSDDAAPAISGSNMTAVAAPTSTDYFLGGKKTYQFVVGSTEGSYQMSVNLADIDDPTTVAYAIKAPATGAVTNAEVLAAIVKLIASINKQIRALQKSLKR